MARLRHAGREGSALDGVSPALRAWASDFSLRGQRKVTKRKATPPSRPPSADSLTSLSGSDGTPQMVHPCTNCGCAVIPDGAPDPLNSTRRLGGGSTPCHPTAPSNRKQAPSPPRERVGVRGVFALLLTQQPT